jgi:hypothetical protein
VPKKLLKIIESKLTGVRYQRHDLIMKGGQASVYYGKAKVPRQDPKTGEMRPVDTFFAIKEYNKVVFDMSVAKF